MKKSSIRIPEWLYIFSFLLYLYGSSMTLIEHGIELSLWLMTFAVLITLLTTTLPWLGIQWIKLDKKGWQLGWWLSLLLQVISWITFGYAMFMRLNRNLSSFFTFITMTTLFWAAWLILFIYSRYAPPNDQTGDKLTNENDIRQI